MTDIQIDWLGAAVFIVPPIAYLLTQSPFSNKDNLFYEHFSSRSSLFPSGRGRIIFPIAWWILFIMEGIAAYVFWHDADTTTGPHLTTYNVGLCMYWVQLVFSMAWMKLFFHHKNPRWVPFVAILVIDGGVVGALTCACILSVTYSIVAFSLLLLWLVYANILTIVAWLVIPVYNVLVDPLASTDEIPQSIVYAEKQQNVSSAVLLQQLKQQQHQQPQQKQATSSSLELLKAAQKQANAPFNPSKLKLPGRDSVV